jgi:hypothetical protein
VSHYSYLVGYITYPSMMAGIDTFTVWSDMPHVKHLQSVIDGLPEIDTFPYLSREMFSITTEHNIYRDGVIHFAASMKDIVSFWNEWEEKFERFLSRLGTSWYEAKVFVWDEYMGDFIIKWQRDVTNMDAESIGETVSWKKEQLYVKETIPGWLGKDEV